MYAGLMLVDSRELTDRASCMQGYHDQEYKQRRVMIANIAREHEV